MKRGVLVITVLVVVSLIFPAASSQNIPDWVKNTAGWWATDAISETEFVNAMEFLIKDNIIDVTSTLSTTNSGSVPDWVKNTAGWWATDAISETEFINAIGYLVKIGIINIEIENNCVNDLLKYFDNEAMIIDACKKHESIINEELIPYDIELKFNSEGFRGEEFPKQKSSDIYRIFMIGGSTMLSAETTNDATIPSILQKMYELENLDTEIEIINAGVSGANTLTELKLIKSKIINYNPDLIIMYDGWNDLSADHSVNKIINNYELVCETAIENNFELIITLQPIAGFGNKSLTLQEKINSSTGKDHSGYQLLQAKSTYDYLGKELEILDEVVKQNFGDVCNTHDLRFVFDGVSGPIYWDQGHTMHAGNLILAEKLFEISIQKIDPTIVSSNKFTDIISNYNSKPIIKFLLNEIGINQNTFENKLKDMTKIDFGKGDFFKLKNEFGDPAQFFVGKDLRDIDLEEIDLNGKDLTGADLSGQDLRNIDFNDAIIRGSNLSNTNLEGKDMSGMDLRGIKFKGANLRDVNFTDAIFSKTIQVAGNCNDENPILNVIKNFKCVSVILQNESIRTDFTDADLTNAQFGIKENKGNQMVYFTDFTNADLTDVNLYSVQFFGCNFTDAKLNGISGKQVFILESNFTNSEMKNFQISETWLQSTLFNKADMRNGDFDSITFIDLDFSETNFQGTEFSLLNDIGNNNYSCKNNAICQK